MTDINHEDWLLQNGYTVTIGHSSSFDTGRTGFYMVWQSNYNCSNNYSGRGDTRKAMFASIFETIAEELYKRCG